MLLLIFIFGLMLYGDCTKVKCLCNLNHPRLAIRECPDVHSNIIGFMDQSDRNTLLGGVVDTSSPYCEPLLEQIHTPASWSAIRVIGNVGFVSRDYGERIVNCSAVLTGKERTLQMPKKCPQPSSTPNIHIISSKSTTRKPTTILTTPMTTIHSPTSFGCLKFETIIQSQKHEPVIHPLARTCIGGESESEGVIYLLCNSTHMSHWKRGTKVKGHCHDNIIPTFTAIASFFHDRPIDAGIYAGCNPNSEINIFQQKCGSSLELTTITGYEMEDYYTILL